MPLLLSRLPAVSVRPPVTCRLALPVLTWPLLDRVRLPLVRRTEERSAPPLPAVNAISLLALSVAPLALMVTPVNVTVSSSLLIMPLSLERVLPAESVTASLAVIVPSSLVRFPALSTFMPLTAVMLPPLLSRLPALNATLPLE